MRGVFILLLACLFLVPAARAGEIYELYHGARSLGMGNAYTALADDEQAVFLNPAGLAGNKKYTFHYLVSDSAISWDTIGLYLGGGLSALSDAGGSDLAGIVMGKNIYGREQITSTLVMPNVGVSIFVDEQVSISTVNRVLPRLTMGYQTTNGVQAAFGVSLGRSLKKKHEVRLGIGPKLLWRRGGYQTLPTMTLLNMNMGKLSQVTGPFGRGFGVDLGAQYLFYLNSRFTLSYGIAYTDVGDTTFDSIAQRIKGNLSNGVAATYNLGRGKISMIYDYRHVLDDTDWRKKNHVGLEVQMPFISIYGGINQVYYTYGAAFDVWLFRITGFSYAEEHGSFAHQNPERRYGMRAGLKFDL